MFYDIKVMNSRTLGAAWQLANQVSVDTSKVGLTKMCSSLNKCLESGRLSLRTSSVFVNGTTRVFQEGAEQLYRDCIKLNKEMIRRTNRPSIEEDTHSNYTEGDSRSKKVNSEAEIQRNSNSHCKYSNRTRNNPYPIQRSRNERSPTNDLENLTDTDKTNASPSSSSTTNEIGVQTTKSFISDRNKKKNPNPNIDKTQPFGLVMVCDTESQIPKKIMYSKINVQAL